MNQTDENGICNALGVVWEWDAMMGRWDTCIQDSPVLSVILTFTGFYFSGFMIHRKEAKHTKKCNIKEETII